jgi:hypothetical protein
MVMNRYLRLRRRNEVIDGEPVLLLICIERQLQFCMPQRKTALSVYTHHKSSCYTFSPPSLSSSPSTSRSRRLNEMYHHKKISTERHTVTTK